MIGTSHIATNYQNTDTLIEILNKIKPDVVLIELDSSFFTKKFDFDTLNFPDILEKSNENNATFFYKKSYKIDIRPFDITGRNDFYERTDFFRKQGEMYSKISDLYNKGMLNERNRKDFELFDFTLNLTNNIKYSSLQELNSLPALKLTELRQKILYNETIEIVKSDSLLHKWIDFAELQKDFWIKRNKVMVENIVKISKQYKKEKIVVFVGANHKYFILNLLKKENDNNFLIKDYFK